MSAFFKGMAYSLPLMLQIWCQPSKAYRMAEKETFVYLWGLGFAGLFVSVFIAWPHYYLYGKWLVSIFFSFSFSFSFIYAGAVVVENAVVFAYEVEDATKVTIAIAGAGAVASVVELVSTDLGAGAVVLYVSIAIATAFAVAGVGGVAAAGATTLAVAGAVAGAFAVAGEVALAIAITGALTVASVGGIFIGNIFCPIPIPFTFAFFFLIYGIVLCLSLEQASNSISEKKFNKDGASFFCYSWIVLCFCGGAAIPPNFRVIEATGLLVSFCFCFIIFVSIWGYTENNKIIRKYKEKKKLKDNDISRQALALSQRATLVWCPLLALICNTPSIFGWWAGLSEKLAVIGIGFLTMPLLILRIPDYIICLPIWLFQRFRMTRNQNNAERLINQYENSLLFKHEMMFGELFGLARVLTGFARNPEIGVAGAAERITHVYWFTFQQKQAQKAVLMLGQEPDTAHAFIHYLLKETNDDLLKGLAQHSNIAKLYWDLYPASVKKKKNANAYFSINLPKAGGLLKWRKSPEHLNVPEDLLSRLNYVLKGFSHHADYQFNAEISESLTLLRDLLDAEILRDLIAVGKRLNQEIVVPEDIPYLSQADRFSKQLSPILSFLRDVDNFDRKSDRRNFLYIQIEDIEKLAEGLNKIIYSPFSHLWRRGVENAVAIIKEEIRIQKESARLIVDLVNPTFPVMEKSATITFRVTGESSEIASDVRLEVKSDDPRLFDGTKTIEFQSIASDSHLDKTLPISARTPMTTWVRGHLYYSDRIQADKSIPFSFPVTIYEEKAEFREIPNLYVAGKALSPENQLFIERQDVYKFIDSRITAGGEHHTIALHGLRRTGKSSLLKRIERDGFTNPDLKPVYFDMQGVDDEPHFYKELAKAVSPARYRTARDSITGFGSFRYFMDDAEPELNGKIPVILMDEFETLQERVMEDRISKAVFSHLRHLMQHENRLIMLFCGAHQIEELSADYWGAFFNTATYCRIDFFTREDTDWLAQNPVKEDLKYDELTLDRLWRLTSGHPYLVQLICHTLVERLNTKEKRNYALVNDMDAVAERIVEMGNDQFCPWVWKTADLTEKLVLCVLASLIEDTLNERAHTEDIWEKIAPLKKGKRSECVNGLHRMESRGILNATDAGYGFPIGLLQRYITIKHPFQRVRAEI